MDRWTLDRRTCWIAIAVIMLVLGLAMDHAYPRDNGQYAGSPLKSWFDQLSSGKGRCCSDADGTAVSDPDWDSKDGHYRVRLDGEWIDVPDDAVIKEPNRAGPTMVWPFLMWDGKSHSVVVRCFMPGSMT